MKLNNKLINLVVIFTFLLNSISSNVSLAQTVAPSLDNLSPVLRCNDLLGIEHKDYFRIQFALKPHLELINSRGVDIDLKTFKETLGYRTRKETTVFYPAEVQFFYNEAELLRNGDISVMCRVADPVKDKISRTERLRTYYLIISTKDQDNNGEFLFKEIFTEEEYNKVKGDLTRFGSRNLKDEEIIRRYSDQNESIIDNFIQKRILSGDFTEIEAQREILGWDINFPDAIKPEKNSLLPIEFYQILRHSPLKHFFSLFNINIKKVFMGKNVIFVKVPKTEGFPHISMKIDSEGFEVAPQEEGKTVELEVQSHTSQNAVYIFLNEDYFDELLSATQKFRKENTTIGYDEKKIISNILPQLVHEAGVTFGLQSYYKKNKILNNLDRVWQQFEMTRFSQDNIMFNIMPTMINTFPDLKKLSERPIDLNANLENRDYLMGIKVKKTSEQKLNKQIFDAFKSILTIKPNSAGAKRKGIRAVNNFLKLIERKTGTDSYIATWSVIESDWFTAQLDNNGFRKFLTTSRVSNFMDNVWNVYKDYIEGDSDKYDVFDIFPQKLFLLLYELDRLLERENAERGYENKIAIDYVGFYRSIYALLYGGYTTKKVVDNFEDAKTEAIVLIEKMRFKDTEKLKERIRKNAGEEVNRIIDTINREQAEKIRNESLVQQITAPLIGKGISPDALSRDKQQSPENFILQLKSLALGKGIGFDEIDELIVLAAEKNVHTLVKKLIVSGWNNLEMRNYLESVDVDSLDITSSSALVLHLKAKFRDFGVLESEIDQAILALASSNTGDLIYLNKAIEAQSYEAHDYGKYKKEMDTLVSDRKSLNAAAGVLAYLTKYSYAEIYILSSFLEFLMSDISEDILPANKEDLLYLVSDKVYGANKGMTSLVKVLEGENGEDLLILKMKKFLPMYIKMLIKRRRYPEATSILENYLKILENFENKEESKPEVIEIVELLNETYVNSISYNISTIYNIRENEPVFEKLIQGQLTEVLKTHNKRKGLWSDRGESMPIATIGMNQVLYALIFLLPENNDGINDNYEEVIKFFESIDLWSWIESIENDSTGKVSLYDFFNLYTIAIALNDKSFAAMERDNKPLLDYCMYRLFGAERANEAKKKIFFERSGVIKQEKSVLDILESLKVYYYHKAKTKEFLDTLKKVSRYASHQIKTIGDRALLTEIFSESYQLEIYLLSKIVDFENLGGFFNQEKSYVEYFADQLYGEGKGIDKVNKILGGKDGVIRMERTLLGLLEIIHSSFYEANNFNGMKKIFGVYEKYLMHQKKALNRGYTIKDIIQRDDISFYYYVLLLSPEHVADLISSGLNFINFAGQKLFGKDESVKASIDILKVGPQDKQDIQDPNFGFVDMYNDIIERVLRTGQNDNALNMIDLFYQYLTYQKEHIGEIEKEYFELVIKDLDQIQQEFQSIAERVSGDDVFAREALKVWQEKVFLQKKRAEDAIRKEEKAKVEFLQQKEQKRAKQVKEAEEKRRNDLINQLDKQRTEVGNRLGVIDKKLELARKCISDKRLQAAEELISEILKMSVMTDVFVTDLKKLMPELDNDLKARLKDDFKKVDPKQSEIKKEINRLSEQIIETKRKIKETLEDIRKVKEKKIAADKVRLENELSKRADIDEKFEQIFEEAAEALDLIDEHRLVDARNSLKKLESMDKNVSDYLNSLGEIMLSLSGKWRKIFIDLIDEIKILKEENGDLSIQLVKNKILEEEREEAANLNRKWKQVEDGISEIKGIIKQVYSFIKDKKIQAAGKLYQELKEEKMAYHLTPIDGYLSFLEKEIEDNGRTDLIPLREKALALRKKEVEQCVELLGNTLEKEKIAFEKELVKVQHQESMLFKQAEDSLNAIEDPARQAMSHAKGLVLNLAETVIAKAEEHFLEAGKHLEELTMLVETAEGDRKSSLEEHIGILKDARNKTKELLSKLTERVEKEKKSIDNDRDKKEDLYGRLTEAIESLENASTLISEWELEQVEQDIKAAEAIVLETETYLQEEGLRTTKIIGPRKKQLLGFVWELKGKKSLLDEKIESIKEPFDRERKKARKEIDQSKEMEEVHHIVFGEVAKVREALKSGDLETAQKGLIAAKEKSDLMKKYLEGLEQKITEKDKNGRKKWLEDNIGRFKFLFSMEREKIASANKKFDFEKSILENEEKEYMKEKALLGESLSLSSDIIERLKQGNIRGSEDWVAGFEEARRSVEAYVDRITREVKAVGEEKNYIKKNRLLKKVDDIRKYLIEVEVKEKEIQRLFKEAINIEKTDEVRRREVEESLQNIRENMNKSKDSITAGEIEIAEHFVLLISEGISFIKSYLATLVQEQATGKRKLLLAKNKLEINRALQEVELEFEKVTDLYDELKLKPFLTLVNKFSTYAFKECSNTIDEISISVTSDLMKVSENINYIEFFRRVLMQQELKDPSEMSLNTSINALVALLDFGDDQEQYMESLKEALENDYCTQEKKALIYTTLLRNGVDVVENYRKLQSMMENNPTLKTEIIIRGLFLEMGYNVQDQIDYLNGIFELDEDEYNDEGLNYLDEAWVCSALFFNGIDVEENFEWFSEGFHALADMLENNEVDPEFETQIYYVLTKNSLINKYAARKDKFLAKQEILDMAKNSEKAGLEIPTNINTRYTLIMPADLFNNGDLSKYESEYAERFNIKTIGAQGGRKFVNKVFSLLSAHNNSMSEYKIDNEQVVVLLPSTVPDEQLQRLISGGIRFVRIDEESILNAKTSDIVDRESFHRNTFAIMILSRILDKNKMNESYMRRLIEVYKFYLKSHFDLGDITPEAFATAVVQGNLNILVKGLLQFKPMERYAMPEYDKVQETLIFA